MLIRFKISVVNLICRRMFYKTYNVSELPLDWYRGNSWSEIYIWNTFRLTLEVASCWKSVLIWGNKPSGPYKILSKRHTIATLINWLKLQLVPKLCTRCFTYELDVFQKCCARNYKCMYIQHFLRVNVNIWHRSEVLLKPMSWVNYKMYTKMAFFWKKKHKIISLKTCSAVSNIYAEC